MTIRGLWSLAELKDLLVAKDQEMTRLESSWRGFDPTWMSYDSAADNAWMSDFNALKARYGAARAVANRAIALSDAAPDKQPERDIPADAEYRGILRALKAQDGVVSSGDLQDLFTRLQVVINQRNAATGQSPVSIGAPVWQPMKGSDADLSATNSISGMVNLAMASAGLSVPGGEPNTEKKKTGTFKLLALGGGLTLGAIAAAKLGWKIAKPW
jgi:hypothetical protein